MSAWASRWWGSPCPTSSAGDVPAYGLADIALFQDRPEDLEAAITDAESVRERYTAIWRELHLEPVLPAGDRHAIRAQLRRLNELGFAVDEIEIVPAVGGEAQLSRVRLKATTTNRSFHAHELERLTGIRALEGQARLLLNDLHEYAAWVQLRGGHEIDEAEGARLWRRELFDPAVARLQPAIGARDPVQAYCDVLEHKWLLSERAGRDVGLQAAIAAYVAEGAPAPEPAAGPSEDDAAAGESSPAAAMDDLVE